MSGANRCLADCSVVNGCLVNGAQGLKIEKGLIGFDGDLFVAGKRTENAGVRSLMSSCKTTSAKSNRTEFALAA
jgi:hypothetical protein